MEKFQELSPTAKAVIGTLIGVIAIISVLALASNVALLSARRHDGQFHIFTVFELLTGEDARAVKAARLGLLLGGLAIDALLFKLFLASPQALHGRACPLQWGRIQTVRSWEPRVEEVPLKAG